MCMHACMRWYGCQEALLILRHYHTHARTCQELMRRVAKLLEKVDALALADGQPAQGAPPPITTEAQRREREEGTIERMGPGQWRVLHPTITALALTLHDVYYDFTGRVNEALAAVGLAGRLVAAGARAGDVLVVTPPGGEEGQVVVQVEFVPLVVEELEGVEEGGGV